MLASHVSDFPWGHITRVGGDCTMTVVIFGVGRVRLGACDGRSFIRSAAGRRWPMSICRNVAGGIVPPISVHRHIRRDWTAAGCSGAGPNATASSSGSIRELAIG